MVEDLQGMEDPQEDPPRRQGPPGPPGPPGPVHPIIVQQPQVTLDTSTLENIFLDRLANPCYS